MTLKPDSNVCFHIVITMNNSDYHISKSAKCIWQMRYIYIVYETNRLALILLEETKVRLALVEGLVQ